MSSDSLNVLSLQPFFGGSHRAFQEQWMAHSRHQWHLLTLPARHWKWRMRHAAIWLANETADWISKGNRVDIAFTTDMMNVLEFRALLAQKLPTGDASSFPIVTYFHENQFAYPVRFAEGSPEQLRDLHFAFTNFVTALGSDACWFNSSFNLTSFLSGLKKQAKRWPDFVPNQEIDQVTTKTQVMYPGVEYPKDAAAAFASRQRRFQAGKPLRIVWAARWEHDKGPDRLLAILRELKQTGVAFELSVIGERFQSCPAEFETIREEFSDRLRHWGFLESRESYWECLAEGDVFLSTAYHEFFGIAAAEAIAAGLIPVLPDRLAYPELVQHMNVENWSVLYPAFDSISEEAKHAAQRIADIASVQTRYFSQWKLDSNGRAQRTGWESIAQQMDSTLVAMFEENNSVEKDQR